MKDKTILIAVHAGWRATCGTPAEDECYRYLN